jgi:hypothetical protein
MLIEPLIPSVTVLQVFVRKCQQIDSNCKIIDHVVQLFSPSIIVEWPATNPENGLR